MTTQTNTHTPPDTGQFSRSKSALFCPECGHESPASGDWVVVEREGQVVYECPVCDTTIATRGRSMTVPQC